MNIMNYWADFLPGVPAGGYRTDYRWDDSIVTDTTAEKAQFLQEIAAGVRFLGETKEQAKAACIAETSPTNDGLDS